MMGVYWFSTARGNGCLRLGNVKAVGLGDSRPQKQTKVTANAFTLAQNAIAKAMQSSKTAVAGEVAFA